MKFSSHDHHSKTLYVQLTRTRRAMLWALAENKPRKAEQHAARAFRYARLLLDRGAFVEDDTPTDR